MSKWCAPAESGILRKKPPEKHEELLVFGYACKLFRDDEKAQYIDQGKHLIPWMGDSKLKIDRYDCRGALSELSPFEASREGYDAMRWLGLSDSDRKLEQLCDEERYHSLHINEEEEELYKEEELKRLQQKSNEFQYTYDVPKSDALKTEGPLPREEVEETPFVPPPLLDVPADITIPKTVKENARIEKTALFVSRQGMQMEILIKAKQGDNPQFAFLNQGNELYKYYRHLLSAIKDGRYRVQPEETQEQTSETLSDQEHHEETYLHPLLTQPAPPPSVMPSVPYKPSADCAYSQLVNRIQGVQPEAKQENATASLSYEQQYYQYQYAAQYYEYYKQMAQYQAGMAQGNGDYSQEQAMDPNLQSQYANFMQMAYAQYMQQQQASNNPYAQIVSNLNKDNPYSSLMENIQQNSSRQTPQQPVVTTQAAVQPQVEQKPSGPTTQVSESKPEIVKQPLLALAQYGSDSEDDGSSGEQKDDVKVPPDDMKIIIDKMASYVSKNGVDFEKSVRSKGDSRFEFLNDDHEYHPYYKAKIKEYSVVKVKDVKMVEIVENKPKPKKVIAPVCFSIKKPKDEPPKEIKSALPIEESSDEETVTQSDKAKNGSTPEASVISTITTTTAVTNTTAPVVPVQAVQPESSQEEGNNDENSERIVKETTEVQDITKLKNGLLDPDDPILEMIDLTEDVDEKRDTRKVYTAEERIKDKLASAAREKLASASKDRALQLERKRKAAAFLKLKSAENIQPDACTSPKTNSPKPEEEGRKRSTKEVEIIKIQDDSDTEEGELKRHHKKKKKSHKRKHSRSRSDSRSHKKSKKRRRRSRSSSKST